MYMAMGTLLQRLGFQHNRLKVSLLTQDTIGLLAYDYAACNTLHSCDHATDQQQKRAQSSNAVSFASAQCYPLSCVACLCYSFCLLLAQKPNATQQLE